MSACVSRIAISPLNPQMRIFLIFLLFQFSLGLQKSVCVGLQGKTDSVNAYSKARILMWLIKFYFFLFFFFNSQLLLEFLFLVRFCQLVFVELVILRKMSSDFTVISLLMCLFK